jgi:Cu/Ag efflux protein CusF
MKVANNITGGKQMKTRIAVLGAFIIAVAIALNSAAMAAQEKQYTIKGEVMKVDAAARKVTLQKTNLKKGKEVSIMVSADASIMKGTEKLTLDKLAVGQKVTAKVTRQKGVLTAHDITLQIGAAYAPATAKPKKG